MAPSFGLETAEQKSQTQILSIGYSILLFCSFWGPAEHQDEDLNSVRDLLIGRKAYKYLTRETISIHVFSLLINSLCSFYTLCKTDVGSVRLLVAYVIMVRSSRSPDRVACSDFAIQGCWRHPHYASADSVAGYHACLTRMRSRVRSSVCALLESTSSHRLTCESCVSRKASAPHIHTPPPPLR